MKKTLVTICALLLLTISIQAQEKKAEKEKKPINKTIAFKVKDVEDSQDTIVRPTVYIDGKLFNFDISLIDQNQIESMNVIKGEVAETQYNSPQGVILIKTKEKTAQENTEIRIRGTQDINDADPLIIIDGQVMKNRDILKKLNPDDINSITVLKDETAKALYDEAENGVIIIKTKKGKD